MGRLENGWLGAVGVVRVRQLWREKWVMHTVFTAKKEGEDECIDVAVLTATAG